MRDLPRYNKKSVRVYAILTFEAERYLISFGGQNMKLGEFRKFTENLSDNTDIIIRYELGGEGYIDVPMMNVRLEDKENLWVDSVSSDKSEYSDKVVYVERPCYGG